MSTEGHNSHDPRTNGLFGVYVHWPFCAAKCPYCDFNSHVHRGEFDEAAYVASYEREIAYMAKQAPGRVVQSIFFGGGTPSLMDPRSVAGILDAIAKHWEIDPKAEITLEANPTSVEANRFRGYRAAGVNRVSLGVQSLREGPLAELGRKHTVDEAIAALGAEAIGCMEAAKDLTVEYLKTRKQFGRPIGSFQSLQHRAAEMMVCLEQARSMAMLAAMMAGEANDAERRRNMRAVKIEIGRNARFVGQQTVQMHGGIAMTMEYAGGHYLKRLTVIENMFGDMDHHLAALSEGGGVFVAA